MSDQHQQQPQPEAKLNPSAPIEWTGLPITYRKRLGGYGFIVGKYVYAYNPDGSMESMGRLNMAILDRVMQGCFPNARNMGDVEDILEKTVYDVTAAERAHIVVEEGAQQG